MAGGVFEPVLGIPLAHVHPGGSYQPLDDDLTAIAALGFVSTSFLKKTAADTWALDTNTYQVSDAFLASIAALGTAADKMIYTTGVDTAAEADITTAGRALLDDASADAQLVTLSGWKFIVDTRANILTTTPTPKTLAISTDEPALYAWNGTAWLRSAIPLGTPSTTVDMGALPYNDDHGYGVLDLSDKDLHNVVLKNYDTDRRAVQEGALRKTALTATTNAIQAYVNSAWRTMLAYSAAQEDAIILWTDGWSDVDTFGKNVIHGHKVDMGAFASDHFIDGGLISDQTP